jgi:hypothetical protein
VQVQAQAQVRVRERALKPRHTPKSSPKRKSAPACKP